MKYKAAISGTSAVLLAVWKWEEKFTGTELSGKKVEFSTWVNLEHEQHITLQIVLW
jgi:hypothetical protein